MLFMSIWIFAATQSGQMSGEGKAGPPGGSSRAAFPQGGRGRGRFPGAVPGGDRFPGPAGPGGPPPPFPGKVFLKLPWIKCVYLIPLFLFSLFQVMHY